jgi:hypothetical protein
MPLYLEIGLFLVVEFLLLKNLRWSPGSTMLSIRFDEPERIEPEGEGWSGLWDRPASVDGWIKSHESWLTLLLGVFLVNAGTKELVRWTMWQPPMPFFGFETTVHVSSVIAVSIGLVEIFLAWAVFRLRFVAVSIGVAYSLLNLISVVMSWDLWDAWVAEYVARRRAFQQLPIRENEIEQMQAITPEGVVVVLALLLVLFLILIVPLRRAHAR